MKKLAVGFMLIVVVMSVFATNVREQQMSKNIYVTKFGRLGFFADANQTGIPALIVKLNDSVMLKDVLPSDQNAYRPSFMPLEFMSIDSLDFESNKGLLRRMIIGEGEDGNCIRQFILLDFSGDKPYISNRFGYNPDGKYCLKLKGVKWSKKQVRIELEGPFKYLYHTGGKVVDMDDL